ncbi:MAG TPA: FAD-dependent oxidoreductase [Acidimicrobiales bacterium]|nr:FAD-dependent oxidoreductase [Acidimicrobiales bacterium]
MRSRPEPGAPLPEPGPLSRRQVLRGAGAVAATGLAATSGLLGPAGLSGAAAGAARRTKWGELQRHLRGRLLRPETPGYRAAAPPYNRRYVDVRPRAIAECAGTEDVRTCILWAGAHHVPFAVRAGGHSYAGYSTTDGLLISVSPLRSITANVPAHTVTIGAGVQNRDLFKALPPLDLAVPNGRCPTVGMGGFVLGGGFGFSSRRLGLASDNLVRTTVVTADGAVLTCDEHSHPDLFWALRGGGGGNFGINTRFVLRTHPIGPLSVYKLRWRWEDATAVLDAAQELMASAPDTLSARAGLDVAAPSSPGTPPGLSVSALGQYFGHHDRLQALLAPLLAAAQPTEQVIRSVTHAQAVDFFAANVPVGRFTEKSSYIGPGGFDRTFVQTGMAWIEKWPGSTNTTAVGLTLFAWGGAMGRPAPTDTAFVHRDASWLGVVGTSWGKGDSATVVNANLDWLGGFAAAIAPYVTEQSYQNFADPALADWQRAYYGENFPRLVEVKRTYDPGDLFTFPQGIPVSAAAAS